MTNEVVALLDLTASPMKCQSITVEDRDTSAGPQKTHPTSKPWQCWCTAAWPEFRLDPLLAVVSLTDRTASEVQ